MASLYVTEPGSRLSVESGRLVVTHEETVLASVAAARIDQVVVIGGAHATTPALAFLLDRGIGLVFLTAGGHFRGRLVRPTRPTTPRCAAPSTGGRTIRTSAGRWPGRSSPASSTTAAFAAWSLTGRRTSRRRSRPPQSCATWPSGRGRRRRRTCSASRGQAARLYFDVVRAHLRPPWTLPARERRPPPDPVNALLSLLYTLLHEHCQTALAVVGFDVLCGFYHQPRPGRAALALDLMEEVRPVIADAVALTLLNKRILSPADFRPEPGGKGGI